ncbi:hypothetical protein ACO0LL_13970 [Undibacterium sp. TC4M20W]|uniref:hypothetical protein n=1 Tax=Undibacterium sp. TC4M20W TaxID=3413052 RepID=UPI003BF2DB59
MMLSLIRKISSLLLLLCFVLPLSTCESKMKPQQEAKPQSQSQSANSQPNQQEAVKANVEKNVEERAVNAAKDNSLYGYALLMDGWEDVRKNKTMASSLTMLAVFAVFFLPCGLLVLKEKLQVIIILLASVLAGPALFFWVLVWGKPQVGGVLAILCWISLLLVSLIYCWRWALHWWRQRKVQG